MTNVLINSIKKNDEVVLSITNLFTLDCVAAFKKYVRPKEFTNLYYTLERSVAKLSGSSVLRSGIRNAKLRLIASSTSVPPLTLDATLPNKRLAGKLVVVHEHECPVIYVVCDRSLGRFPR